MAKKTTYVTTVRSMTDANGATLILQIRDAQAYIRAHVAHVVPSLCTVGDVLHSLDRVKRERHTKFEARAMEWAVSLGYIFEETKDAH